MAYFSDRELGEKPRENEIISPTVWGGIVSLINTNIVNGGFGISFPKECPDGISTIGTDEQQMQLSARAEIPNISWPLSTTTIDENSFLPEEKLFAPKTLDILDLIEFCHTNIAKPIENGYHKFFNHHHLTFDQDSGQKEFRDRVNRIFSRNGLIYKIEQNGQIIRLSSPILNEALLNTSFKTSDNTLNEMLQESRDKFLSPDPTKRKEALERLWDSWERIKSLENPNNKRDSTKKVLDKSATESDFRELIEQEALELTRIGNDFHIRHTEVDKTSIHNNNHVDYLFHRLFSLIHLILKSI